MFKNFMRKNRLVKMTVAIVALAALVTGGYIYIKMLYKVESLER